ncbi:M42 family metallopeptidase [Desulfuromonas carbonis]|uniref:M42 family metallopeptidase n=1 Tax=Desulfuromonas sp. DDH964 TaxID=1823759 RepID=UPI00078BA3EF|nr:M42 family aminopeptidase [Desulfuromonas sp. DDH964]
MTDMDFAFFQEFVEAPSPSGFEQPAQRIWRRELQEVADVVSGDMMGNAIARLAGSQSGAPRVMLAGHCDEIGFMVSYIDDQGFLYFAPIGGVDAHLVPGQRVLVHGAAGPVRGVVGKKPIHLMEAKDRESVVKFKSQFIDIGCASRAETEGLVAVGDPLTFAVGLERLQGERVTSRAFDDKMGAFIVARVLQEVKRRGPIAAELFAVSTVQEEIGLRGGTTSAYGIDPDIAIVVEVGFATDHPEVDKKEIGDFRLGGGPILARGANINPALFELLLASANEEGIAVQIMGAPRATGTDANVIQLCRGGVATALVKVPLRYMHSPVEVLDLRDLEATVQLLAAAVRRISDRDHFIPR